MIIHKITPSVDYNKLVYNLNDHTQDYSLCRLELLTEEFKPTNQYLIKVPKGLSQGMRDLLIKVGINIIYCSIFFFCTRAV